MLLCPEVIFFLSSLTRRNLDQKKISSGTQGRAHREWKIFWNNNGVEMKFSFECEWIKAVKWARGQPNYGMGNMNRGLEEV